MILDSDTAVPDALPTSSCLSLYSPRNSPQGQLSPLGLAVHQTLTRSAFQAHLCCFSILFPMVTLSDLYDMSWLFLTPIGLWWGHSVCPPAPCLPLAMCLYASVICDLPDRQRNNIKPCPPITRTQNIHMDVTDRFRKEECLHVCVYEREREKREMSNSLGWDELVSWHKKIKAISYLFLFF